MKNYKDVLLVALALAFNSTNAAGQNLRQQVAVDNQAARRMKEDKPPPPPKDDKDDKKDEKKTPSPTSAPTPNCVTVFDYSGDVDSTNPVGDMCPEVDIGVVTSNPSCASIFTTNDPVITPIGITQYNSFYSKQGFTDYLSYYDGSAFGRISYTTPAAGFIVVDYGAVCGSAFIKYDADATIIDSVATDGCLGSVAEPLGASQTNPATQVYSGPVGANVAVTVEEQGVAMIKSIEFCLSDPEPVPPLSCRVVRVKAADGQPLNLYEVEAFGSSGNLLTATSATLAPGTLGQTAAGPGAEFNAENCINGDYGAYTQPGDTICTGGSINDCGDLCHSIVAGTGELIITYPDGSDIDKVRVWNRWADAGGYNRLNGGSVQVFADLTSTSACSTEVNIAFDANGARSQDQEFQMSYP